MQLFAEHRPELLDLGVFRIVSHANRKLPWAEQPKVIRDQFRDKARELLEEYHS